MTHRRFFIIFIVFLAAICICSCGKKEPAAQIDASPKTEKLVGNKELTNFSVDFSAGYHEKDDIFPRAFEIWITETEYAKYQVESASITETDAKALVALVENDLRQIKDYTGFTPEQKTNIIIVENDEFGNRLGLPFRVENTAVMSPEQIGNNEHYAMTASAYMLNDEQWIGQGIAELLTNVVPDSNYLANYYNDGGNTDIIGMFCARFDERLCGMKEVSIARATAASIVHYMVKKDVNISDPRFVAATKQEWLKTIGVRVPYRYPYEEEFSGFSLRASDNKAYDIVIKSEIADYYIAWQKDKSCIMSDVHNLEYFLHRNNTGLLLLKKSIAENGPDSMKAKAAERFVYYIDETGYQTNAAMEGAMPSGGIYLQDTYSTAHTSIREAVAACAGEASGKWLELGLAEYYSALVLNDLEFMVEERNGFRNCDYRYLIMRDLVFNNDAFDFGDQSWGKAYYSDVLENYLSRGGTMKTQSGFDPALFYDASAFISYKSNESKPYDSWLDTCSIVSKYGVNEEGNELDSYQCGSLVNYLVKTYSLKSVLEVYSDYSKFNSVFGKSYKSLKALWLEEISN
ncbi:MAG: hypothetical protein BWY11_01732 [Firmicutes bacterium ADurb.Bin182]|nr:MAG: hypothetical protein BWY11_01732 [Firmicutes bacterium ADurb.Bin182]